MKYVRMIISCAIVHAASRRLSPRTIGFNPGVVHVGFVVDRVSVGQGFSLIISSSSMINYHQVGHLRPYY
jgi:hypothetical protein